MKKIYNKPVIELLTVEMQNMIAASLTPGENTGTISEDPVPGGTPGEARSFEFWDDEDLF